jgi:Uma2 family endonuclease
MSVTIVISENPPFTVPNRATSNLSSFREWAGDNDLPEKARVDFYKGEVWVDMSQEQIFTHGLVKTEIAAVLRTLTKQNGLGRYWCNGVLVTSIKADLSGNPDGTFISNNSFATRKVTLTGGAEGGYVEIVGTVDMVLEVVSDSSEKKDNQILFEAYFDAGVSEYWLVDARGSEIEFNIYKRGAKKFSVVKPQPGGWVKSAAFGKSFRLTRSADATGNPEFTLEVK